MTTSETNSDRKRWCELIERHLAGIITNDEAIELEQLLGKHHEARGELRFRSNLDTALRADAAKLSDDDAALDAVSLKPSSSRFAIWWLARNWSSIAAGLLLGLFSASLVWAAVLPALATVKKTEVILSEGFESRTNSVGRGLPRQVGSWSGDLSTSIGSTNGVNPKGGSSMTSLAPDERRRFSYAWRFISLDQVRAGNPGESQQIEIVASFHGDSPDAENRYQIRLAAFKDDVAEARTIWRENQVDELALGHVAQTVSYAAGDNGWKTLRVTMDLPAGAKLLLVSLAAGVAKDEAPKTAHYLDDVQVRLITQEVRR